MIQFGLTGSTESSCGLVEQFPHRMGSVFDKKYSINLQNTDMKSQKFLSTKADGYGPTLGKDKDSEK